MVCATNALSQETIDLVYGGDGHDGARAMVRLKNGGYALAGWQDMVGVHDKGTGLVIVTDSLGVLQWKTTLSTNARNQISAIMEREEGGLLAVIEEFPSQEQQGQVVLAELSNNGTILNKYRIGGLGSDVADKIRRTPDGGYVLAGESEAVVEGSHDAWIIKLSPAFAVEWEWRQGTPGRDRFNDLKVLADGSIMAAGNTTRPGKEENFKEQVPWLVKLNGNGKQLWSSQPLLDEAASIRGIFAAPDGSIVFVGFTRQIGQREFNSWIGKTDPEGNLVWQKSLELPKNDYLHSVTLIQDDHYVAVGAMKNLDTDNDAVIVKFSGDGTFVKPDSYTKAGKQQARVVLQTGNNAVVIGGASGVQGAKNTDIWFLKLYELNFKD